MARKNIRLTAPLPALEPLMEREAPHATREWVKLSIEDLEYRLRYAKTEEAQLIQGALRALDDLNDILSL